MTNENEVSLSADAKLAVTLRSGRRIRRYGGASLVVLPTDPWFIKLKKARLRAGMSQRQLAGILEISSVAVSHWERGLSFPRESKYEVLETLFAQKIFDASPLVFSPSRLPENIELLKIYNSLNKKGKEDLIRFAHEILGK